MRQEARLPDQDTVRFTVRLRAPIRLALNLRHPDWALGELVVDVNGRREAAPSPSGSYATLDREGRDGDGVDLGLPRFRQDLPRSRTGRRCPS